jgi:Insertion element 4 transposase N-terminal/Transposase DDE domain
MRRNRVESELAGLGETGFALGALTTVLTREIVAEALAAAGKAAKRACKLPPDLVAWLVVAMGIFRGLNIQEVLARLVDGLELAVRFGPAELPHSTSITHARDRLGWEVINAIFKKLAAVLAAKHEPGVLWHDLVVRALDGCTFLVPDSAENDEAFGRPGTSRGGAKSGFPQLRAVLVLGVFTHIVTHAIFAPYREGELTIAARLAAELTPNTLLLMDRLYYSFAWLAGLLARGVPFLVRAKTGGRTLTVQKGRRLADGSMLAKLVIPAALKRKNPSLTDTLDVRVITYRKKGFRDLTLVTSLLDAAKYPAADVVALYFDRWEVELGVRELKTHQAGERVTFRSKTPDRIRQEAFGLLTAYNCVRGLMAEAAAQKGVEPRRLSFVRCLERIRAAIITFDGADPERFYERLLVSLGCCVLPKKRVGRKYVRAVKLKISKWPRKRPGSKVVAGSR